jgi:hypothetical protein
MSFIKQKLFITLILAIPMIFLGFILVRPLPVVADHTPEHTCTTTGGEWDFTSPPGAPPTEGCVCPSGQIFSAGVGCELGTVIDTDNPGGVPQLEPVENEALGPTYDCNGVQISVNVECAGGDNPILSYLGGVVNFLAAGVGVVVVAMVTLAGVQYITSHGDPQKVSAAKSRLVNAMIGLISFIFLYAFLQWLIPGGLFGGSNSQCEPTGQGGIQEC